MIDHNKIKCKDCPMYTGIKSHGFNDNWGDCKALENAYKMLKLVFKNKCYVEYEKQFLRFLSDDSECIFFYTWGKDDE